MQVASRIRQIPPSATLALNAKANQLKAQGVDIVNFGVGEPDFDTPENIREAAIRAIKEGFTRYTPVGGTPELKEAICAKFQADYGLTYKPAEVLVSCGGKHGLYNLFQIMFEPGDEVVIPAPFWVSYVPMAMLAEAVPVIVPTREANGFKLTAAELKARLTPRTKALVLNSPSNPTGGVYTRKELEELGQVVLEHGLYVISDDIYDKILFDGAKFVNIAMLDPELKARTFILNGVSKAYAMTGWRIGYLLGDPGGHRRGHQFAEPVHLQPHLHLPEGGGGGPKRASGHGGRHGGGIRLAPGRHPASDPGHPRGHLPQAGRGLLSVSEFFGLLRQAEAGPGAVQFPGPGGLPADGGQVGGGAGQRVRGRQLPQVFLCHLPGAHCHRAEPHQGSPGKVGKIEEGGKFKTGKRGRLRSRAALSVQLRFSGRPLGVWRP